MTRWLTETEQVAWRYFIDGVHRLLEHLDQSMQDNHGIPLTDFEILVHLSEAPGGRLRMAEIADHVLISRSRLTYRVDRLVEAGLVVRTKDEVDKRGLFAKITKKGTSLLEQAAATHVEDVQSHLMDHIGDDELQTFSDMWRSVADHSATLRLPF
ncbi:MAG: MarR family transcriptional regulator [Acidimicrobiales bacterium]|nr:MarR family transcriptional regulator [Acidimicrobiales bacterium]